MIVAPSFPSVKGVSGKPKEIKKYLYRAIGGERLPYRAKNFAKSLDKGPRTVYHTKHINLLGLVSEANLHGNKERCTMTIILKMLRHNFRNGRM